MVNVSEICKVCGGRESACKVLGHRPENDRPQWAVSFADYAALQAALKESLDGWRGWMEEGIDDFCCQGS